MKQLQANNEFYETVKKYQKKDGLCAFVVFGIVIGLYIGLAILEREFPVIKENAIIAGSGLNIIMILVLLLFVKIRKESFSTIGIGSGKWKQSCLIGLLFAFFLFFNNCLSHVLKGASFIATEEMIKLVVYYFLVAVCEEIVFRGYIGTRLYGLFKNQWIVLVISGVLFIFMHFPYRMIAYGMSLSDLTIHSMGWVLDLFITHLILSFIYLKTNSIYGSILPHWMSNLAYNLIIR